MVCDLKEKLLTIIQEALTFFFIFSMLNVKCVINQFSRGKTFSINLKNVMTYF